MGIKDLQPKEIKVKIAGNEYNVLPATFYLRNKLVNYFTDLLSNQIEGKLDWNRLTTEIFSMNDPEIDAHFMYCMIDFDKKTSYEEFMKLLNKDKGKSIPYLQKAIHEAFTESTPDYLLRATKKKTISRIVTSLIILSGLTFWLLATVSLFKSLFT